MGILDNKTRVIDLVITQEGRKQMSEGAFVVEYASLTDADVFYESDSNEGHTDPTVRIVFEACNLPQDQITFTANDQGMITTNTIQSVDNSKSNETPFVSSSVHLKEGKLFFSDKYFGRAIRINQVPGSIDDGVKIIYNDTQGNIGNIYIDYSRSNGSITASLSTRDIWIGTKECTYENFVSAVSSSISLLSQSNGPYVNFRESKGFILLDYGQETFGTELKSSGTFANVNAHDSGKQIKSIDLFKGGSTGQIFSGEINQFQFASQITNIITSSFSNFDKLSTISTYDEIYEDDKFEFSHDECVIQTKPFTLENDIDTIDAFFSDIKLSRMRNYAYLPPIVKIEKSKIDKSNPEKYQSFLLGDYPSLGDNEMRGDAVFYGNIIKNMINSSSLGHETVKIIKTSRDNKTFTQIFEISDTNEFSKLDLIDYGEVIIDGKKKKCFFAGKIFKDNRGLACFSNIFAILVEKDEK